MTSRFVALPVNRGDAFLLDRGNKTVLVDGGASEKGLVSELKKHWKQGQRVIDTVVVTHNDLDHTGGIIGLLNSSEFKVREIRLPAYWQSVYEVVANHNTHSRFSLALVKLVHDFVVVAGRVRHASIKELVSEVLRRERGYWDEKSERRYTKRDHIERVFGFSEGLTPTADAFDKLIFVLGNEVELDDTVDKMYDQLFSVMENTDVWGTSFNIEIAAWQLIELSKHVNNIVKISQLSLNNHIMIRYYLHDHSLSIKKGMDDDFLVPVNAKEISSRDLDVFCYSCHKEIECAVIQTVKSISNRYSIPFYALETENSPGVLFCAECCVHPIGMSPDRLVIAAGFHHGAKDNSSAYEKIEKWGRGIIWVRSDGGKSSRPCQKYVDLLGQKFCTICNKPIYKKQPVRLYAIGKNWTNRCRTRTCSCMPVDLR